MPDASSHCIELLRRLDRDRFLTVQFAPSEARSGLYAIYALNQEVARATDVASEPLVARMRVQWWRDALPAILAGKPPNHPIAEALAQIRGTLDERLLSALLSTRADEADAPMFEDHEALMAFLEDTAVGPALLGLGVLGAADNEAAVNATRHAALAWGILGVLRAVPYWAQRRRCQLHAQVCADAGLELEELFAGRRPNALRTAVKALSVDASAYMAAARSYANDVPARARAAMMTLPLANGHLSRLIKAGYDPYAPRVVRGSGPRDTVRLIWYGLRGRY